MQLGDIPAKFICHTILSVIARHRYYSVS